MRYNSFALIHKALRALLYDTAQLLQQTYFADQSEAEIALARIEEVIYHFDQHAHHEDHFILPAIEAFEPGLVESFEDEHVHDIELGNRLINMLSMFRSLENDMEKINCGSAINLAFREFMVFNIEHMAKEETELNRVLWDNYTDEELIELNGRLVAHISPADMAFNAKWFMKSINKAEAIGWLKAVKATTPSFIFEQLLAMTETELPERMRAEVQEAVLEDELVA